jgi:hypothetical protein
MCGIVRRTSETKNAKRNTVEIFGNGGATYFAMWK